MTPVSAAGARWRRCSSTASSRGRVESVDPCDQWSAGLSCNRGERRCCAAPLRCCCRRRRRCCWCCDPQQRSTVLPTPTQAVENDVVTLRFTASEAISTPVATFKSGGAAITETSVTYVNTGGNIWTASYIVNANDTSGNVTFSVAFSDTAAAGPNAGTAVER